MDIIASGGQFMVTMSYGGIKTKWNKGGTLSVWPGSRQFAMVSVGSEDFVSAKYPDGKVAEIAGSTAFLTLNKKQPVVLSFRKLPTPKLTKTEMNRERKRVTRTLLSDGPGSLGIPDTLEGTIKWMQAQLKKVPKDYRAKASFEFSTKSEYGDTYPNVEISYEELETDKEIIDRVKIQRERDRIAERVEREQLDTLKKKYLAEEKSDENRR